MRLFSLGRVVFWITLAPIAYRQGWLASVKFVSFLSLWALVETSWAAYRADSPNSNDSESKQEEE